MNKNEVKNILDNHRLWIGTEGEDGKRADFSEEVLYKAKLCGAELRFADLSGVNLEDADLKGANLMGADLSDADLSGADFSGANLSGANLGGADLSNSVLIGADLSGANLSGADLRHADLKDANLDFAALPLWCGGVNMKIDDRQTIQLLYHLLKNVSCSGNVSPELKSLLLQREIVDKANEFYMSAECGKIE